jgi:hypothetical protein
MKLRKSNVFYPAKKTKESGYILVCTRNKYLTEPYKTEYKVTEIVKDDLYRVDFNLGFREPTKST